MTTIKHWYAMARHIIGLWLDTTDGPRIVMWLFIGAGVIALLVTIIAAGVTVGINGAGQ